MASPLYFFPALTRAQLAPDNVLVPEVLANYGDLARTLADVTNLRRDASLSELTGPGPGGHSGCLLCALPVGQPPPVRLCYAPQFQTWTKVVAGGGWRVTGPATHHPPPATIPELWIGTDNEHPVTAADLRRRNLFHGYELELAGQTYTVPVVRDPDGGTGLPRDFHYGDGGKVQERIKSAYFAVWEKFAKAVWLFFDPEGPWPLRIDLSEGTDLCIEALALNYRVGRAEQNLLGLVDSETWYTILAAAVDYPTYRDVAEAVEAQKKTRVALAQPVAPLPLSAAIALAAGSTAISPGPPEDSPATAPAAANCEPSAAGSGGG